MRQSGDLHLELQKPQRPRGVASKKITSQVTRQRATDTRHRPSDRETHANTSPTKTTHLTSPPTPLHPSLPLVQGARSEGFRCVLLHVPDPAEATPDPRSRHSPSPSPASPRSSCTCNEEEEAGPGPGAHLSFSHSSTSRISAPQCLSSSLSLSIQRRSFIFIFRKVYLTYGSPVNVPPPFVVLRFILGLPLSKGMIQPWVNGCVHMKGDIPRMKNRGRSGINGRIGSRRREERSVSVRRREVCVDRWVIWGVRGKTRS
jgi:hypothetical protein